MRRGTTPAHIFTLPFSTEYVSKIKVAYKQEDSVVLRKNTEDCILKDDKVTVTLTRDETLLFNDRYFVKVQLEAELREGGTLVSAPFVLRVGELLCEEGLV